MLLPSDPERSEKQDNEGYEISLIFIKYHKTSGSPFWEEGFSTTVMARKFDFFPWHHSTPGKGSPDGNDTHAGWQAGDKRTDSTYL